MVGLEKFALRTFVRSVYYILQGIKKLKMSTRISARLALCRYGFELQQFV